MKKNEKCELWKREEYIQERKEKGGLGELFMRMSVEEGGC